MAPELELQNVLSKAFVWGIGFSGIINNADLLTCARQYTVALRCI